MCNIIVSENVLGELSAWTKGLPCQLSGSIYHNSVTFNNIYNKIDFFDSDLFLIQEIFKPNV